MRHRAVIFLVFRHRRHSYMRAWYSSFMSLRTIAHAFAVEICFQYVRTPSGKDSVLSDQKIWSLTVVSCSLTSSKTSIKNLKYHHFRRFSFFRTHSSHQTLSLVTCLSLFLPVALRHSRRKVIEVPDWPAFTKLRTRYRTIWCAGACSDRKINRNGEIEKSWNYKMNYFDLQILSIVLCHFRRIESSSAVMGRVVYPRGGLRVIDGYLGKISSHARHHWVHFNRLCFSCVGVFRSSVCVCTIILHDAIAYQTEQRLPICHKSHCSAGLRSYWHVRPPSYSFLRLRLCIISRIWTLWLRSRLLFRYRWRIYFGRASSFVFVDPSTWVASLFSTSIVQLAISFASFT